MSRQKIKKRKRGNIAGRKDPAFGQLVKRICQSTLLTKEEFDEEFKAHENKQDELGREIVNLSKGLPEGITVVDTLYGHQLYKDARLMDFIEDASVICQEFDEFFWCDYGSSICDLRRDRKNRTWCDDQLLLQFCYVLIAMDLAEWSKPRTEWKELPAGMPFIKFKGPQRQVNQPIVNEGETHVETQIQ